VHLVQSHWGLKTLPVHFAQTAVGVNQNVQAHGDTPREQSGYFSQLFQARGMAQAAAQFPCKVNVFHAPSVSFADVTPLA
jgi:hypothetical protein